MRDAPADSRFTACSSESNRQDASSKLATAVSRAAKAREHDRNDEDAQAVAQLKMLFNQ